jgi:predicted GH43/DUF377 family glycosyl hydrolase
MSPPLSERILWPAMSVKGAGMEDARFVRFVDDDGSVTFYASYTAYSGAHISQQLLETEDFRTFTSTPIVAPMAALASPWGCGCHPRHYLQHQHPDRGTEE